ncbi:MAG: zinc-binding dehydrogenase [Candidatus Rokubacteria bacterium]|nr:zinc-binding dehydrogenase [Candidatus Rokubacteria bacterium]
MAETGRAWVFTGAGQPFEPREFPLPEAEPGAILVRVSVATICGSDLHGWHGRTPRSGPTIMGHEMTGRVHRLGAGVASDALGAPLREGDRIVYSYFVACGRCEACRAGDRHHCTERRIGAGRARSDRPPHFTGAYAEYYYLRPGAYVLRAPEVLDDFVVAPLNCALAQVIYGFHQAGLEAGDAVVVQGAGGLGLYATAVARERGARTIVVLDRVPERLALAREFGADHALDIDAAGAEGVAAQVRELTGGGGHVVLELTGRPEAIAAGLAMTRAEGRYVLIGNITAGVTIPFDPSWVVHQNRRVIGVGGYQAWALRRGLELLARARDRYPWKGILSHRYPLAEINQAFADADCGRAIRAALVAG